MENVVCNCCFCIEKGKSVLKITLREIRQNLRLWTQARRSREFLNFQNDGKGYKKAIRRPRALIIQLSKMTNKRKVEWDAVMDKADKASKKIQEEYRDERLKIAKSVIEDIHAQFWENVVGNEVWVFNGDKFELRTILAQTKLKFSPNTVLCVATRTNDSNDLEIDHVTSSHKLEQFMVLPASLKDMTSEETLKMYQEMNRTLGLNLEFVISIE